MLTPNAVTQPPQRIIIGFDSALPKEQQQTFQEQLESLIKQPYQVLDSSDNQRWVVVLNSPNSPDQIAPILKSIEALPQVKYAELDSLLKAQ